MTAHKLRYLKAIKLVRFGAKIPDCAATIRQDRALTCHVIAGKAWDITRDNSKSNMLLMHADACNLSRMHAEVIKDNPSQY